MTDKPDNAEQFFFESLRIREHVRARHPQHVRTLPAFRDTRHNLKQLPQKLKKQYGLEVLQEREDRSRSRSTAKASPQSQGELRQARIRFAELLAQPKSLEREWQRLFAENPYILSNSLPLSLEPDDIIIGGRPGISETDFYLYPKRKSLVDCFGAVELKTPGSKILRSPRKNLLDFSATASCAIRQAQKAVKEFRAVWALDPSRTLLFGNEDHVFVIMGLSHELVQKVHLAFTQSEFRELVSERHCNIIPYDTLLRMYEMRLPLRLDYLSLETSLSPNEIHELLHTINDPDERLYFATNQGWDDSACHLLSQNKAIDPNRRFGPQGSTPLMYASFYGDYFLVRRLLQAGAEVNMSDGLGRAPLWAAAINNHVEVAQLLLQQGADVEAMTYDGWTLLPLYERRAFFSEIRELLRHYGYLDMIEKLTPSALTDLESREQILTLTAKYDDVIPLLTEKYIWLYETKEKLRSGMEICAPGVLASKEDILRFEEQLRDPELVLMNLGVLCCRSGQFDRAIDLMHSLIERMIEAGETKVSEAAKMIIHTELGNLEFLRANEAGARKEWITAREAAQALQSEPAVDLLTAFLAALERRDDGSRSELKENILSRNVIEPDTPLGKHIKEIFSGSHRGLLS